MSQENIDAMKASLQNPRPTDEEWARFIYDGIAHCTVTKTLALEMMAVDGDTEEQRAKRLIECIKIAKFRVIDFEVLEKDLSQYGQEHMEIMRATIKAVISGGVKPSEAHHKVVFFVNLYNCANEIAS